MPDKVLIDLLDKYQIPHEIHKHRAVFTVEEGLDIKEKIPGAHSKNLFLRDDKKNYYLVSVLSDKRVDLKALRKALQAKGTFSFGKPEAMMEKLKLTPGSVTPYGLIHDQPKSVHFVLDKDFLNHETVNFHPLRNDQTLNASADAFMQIMELLGHMPEVIQIPEKACV